MGLHVLLEDPDGALRVPLAQERVAAPVDGRLALDRLREPARARGQQEQHGQPAQPGHKGQYVDASGKLPPDAFGPVAAVVRWSVEETMTIIRQRHFRAALAGLVVVFAVPASYADRPMSAFQGMDANRDGKVTGDEHAAAAKKMFDAMDANKDGAVTAAEMDAAHEQVTGQKAKPSDMPAAEKIKTIDTDGDGVLTAAEHAAGSRTMFDAMDTGKDGSLSEAELAAGHAKMMKKAPK